MRQNDVDGDTITNVLRPSEFHQIRFDEHDQSVTLTLPATTPQPNTFPTSQEGQAASNAHDSIPIELQRLLSATIAASLEQSSESRTDPTAGKLEKTAFLIYFCPYTTGIIDVVQQILLPCRYIKEGDCGIRVELCELTFHRAPGKPTDFHISGDTGSRLIGRLVVGLPIEHQGEKQPPLRSSFH